MVAAPPRIRGNKKRISAQEMNMEMENTFAIAGIETGKLNALVKNLMKQMGIDDPSEAVRRINSGAWVVSQLKRHWHEADGVIYFSVTSDGTTGEDWISQSGRRGFRVGKPYAEQILRSPDFQPTSGVTTGIAVLKGELFTDENRITSQIRAEAKRREWMKPNAEVACLIREKFTDAELLAMGLWGIVVMHEPIEDSDRGASLLCADRRDGGGWLDAVGGGPGRQWGRGCGFAFAVPQVSSEH